MGDHGAAVMGAQASLQAEAPRILPTSKPWKGPFRLSSFEGFPSPQQQMRSDSSWCVMGSWTALTARTWQQSDSEAEL